MVLTSPVCPLYMGSPIDESDIGNPIWQIGSIAA
jgi:hypothetical protein